MVLGWLPAHGMYASGSFSGLGDLMRHLVLPAGVVCVSDWGGSQTDPFGLSGGAGRGLYHDSPGKGLNDRAAYGPPMRSGAR